MDQFIQKHQEDVAGVLSGWDRVRFRGTVRWLANCRGMMAFLWSVQVLLKDFKGYATEITERIRRAGQALATDSGRRVVYLNRSTVSKEEVAMRIAAQEQITQGLVCVLTCVEPCFSYEVHRNRQRRELELRGGQRKCLHQYFYAIDPQLGWMHLRLQTWFPFNVHVCVNGREWLGRQMDAAGIDYERRDNCFTKVADVAGAQALLEAQLQTNFPGLLNGLLDRFHPLHATMCGLPLLYYWSAEQTEWASDVMFHSPQALARLYPRLLRHTMQSVSSADVMRFLGRRVPGHGQVHGRFEGQVVSDCKRRPEGVRVKHQLNGNSIKMYDKQGSVLRVETTINDPRDMKVYRAKEGDPQGQKDWRRLRKGVADLPRRAELSQRANERYADGLASVDSTTTLGEAVGRLCRPTRFKGRRVRALQPLAKDDQRLLEALRRGEWAIHGFRNRDLRQALFGADPASERARKSRAGKVSRLLRLLRAHHLVRKVSRTHRYIVTTAAYPAIDAILAARNAKVAELQELAA